MRKIIMVAAAAAALLGAPAIAEAQGIIGGAREGTREGSRIGGPVGGVVGGAVGAGVGGAVGGVRGVIERHGAATADRTTGDIIATGAEEGVSRPVSRVL